VSREHADPNCPICKGMGFVYPACLYTRPGERGGHFCECTVDALRLVNMDRVWPSLAASKEFEGLRNNPPLRHFVKTNLWITAPVPVFRAHLKALAFRKPALWDCRVYPDAELITSWLGTAKAEGLKIYDLDAERSTLEAIDLRDLVEPPELLILLLGVKQLPNKEAPNSLLEAIGYRQHAAKPVWIVDQPDHRIDHVHHRFYSETLEMWLTHWPHVQLAGRNMRKAGGPAEPVETVGSIEQVDEMLEAKVDNALSDLGSLDGNDAEAELEEDPLEEESSPQQRTTRDLSHTLTVESSKKAPRYDGKKRSR
jgi:hypothetical protein